MPPDSISAATIDLEVKETIPKSSTTPNSKTTNHVSASTAFPNSAAATLGPQFPASICDDPLPPAQSPPIATTEIQKLSSNRIEAYLADPIDTLPQYKHNTSQRSIEHHEVALKAQLENLSSTIDNYDE